MCVCASVCVPVCVRVCVYALVCVHAVRGGWVHGVIAQCVECVIFYDKLVIKFCV